MPDYFFDFRFAINFFELAAAIAGTATWHKWKAHPVRWMTLYLWVIFACEMAGDYMSDKYNTNVWLYSYIVMPLEILFFCWLYNRYFKAGNKKLPIVGAMIFIAAWVTENFLLQTEGFVFKSLAYSAGTVVILLLVITFFTRLFQSDSILTFRQNIMFWISLGLLIFYVGTFPFYSLYNYLAKDMSLFKTHAWIMIFLNYTMYLLFIIGFIWAKPEPDNI
jgi:hypothetical protein